MTPFPALCKEKLPPHRSSNDTSAFHLDLLAPTFSPHTFSLMQVHLSSNPCSECFVFCSRTYEKILWSLSQRTFVPTRKCFHVVSARAKSCSIIQRMKVESSCSKTEFIQHFLSVRWHACHISCKWMCKKILKLNSSAFREEFVMVFTFAVGWQNGNWVKFPCRFPANCFHMQGFHNIMYSHDASCICAGLNFFSMQ